MYACPYASILHISYVHVTLHLASNEHVNSVRCSTGKPVGSRDIERWEQVIMHLICILSDSGSYVRT